MVYFLTLVFAAPVFLAATEAFMSSKVVADSNIQPGTGVGALKLGDDVEVAHEKIGRRMADKAQRLVYQDVEDVWLSYNDLGITLVFDYRKKLKNIIVTSKGLIVEGTGIRIGSEVDEVERNYGKSNTVRKINGSSEIWEYPNIGINFTINNIERQIDVITVTNRKTVKK